MALFLQLSCAQKTPGLRFPSNAKKRWRHWQAVIS
jgi:hypothetical protein